MLNQRFPQSNYFDTPQEYGQQRPQISRHNSNTTIMHMNNNNMHNQGHNYGNVHDVVDTPNSLNSPNSFLVNSFSQNDTPSSIPATPLNVLGMLPSSIPNTSTTSMLSAQMKQQQHHHHQQHHQQQHHHHHHHHHHHQQKQHNPQQHHPQHQQYQLHGQDMHSKQLKVLEQYRASKPPIFQHEGIDDELIMLGNNNTSGNNNDIIESIPEINTDMVDTSMSMIDEEFFRNYTSLHNDDDDDDDDEDDEFDIPGLASQDSSQLPSTQISPLKISIAAPKLTQFTSTNDAFATVNNDGGRGNGGATSTDYKDLDWLKFEL